MTSTSERRCRECQKPLPDDARGNRRHCSNACKNRSAARRYRAKQRPAVKDELDQNGELQNKLDKSKKDVRTLEKRLAERNLKIRSLKNALKRAENQVEVAADEQAQRTRTVRDQLATTQTEMATLKRNWSVRSNADTASEPVTQLRTQLATVTGYYNELATKYQELTAAAKAAAEERKHLQGIVRQWDHLCKRLHVATGGRPRKNMDKKILTAWLRFRKLVRK